MSLGRRESRERLASGDLLEEASGVYYQANDCAPARIELFLDTILGDLPKWIVHVPMVRYEIVGRILFHQLGHHVLATRHPTAPSNEMEASALGGSLFSQYLRARYRGWLWVIHPIRCLYRLVPRLLA